MFFFGDFIEPARDADAAPWRWRWPPGATAHARFGARAARAAVGLVRYSFAPETGPWRLASVRSVGGAPAGHALWEADIPSPAGETSCLYEIGYRALDGAEHWSGRRRPLVFSEAPHAGLGQDDAQIAPGVSGPAPRTAITPGPDDWPARTSYALLLDRFAIGRPERRGLGLARHDLASPFAAHGGDLAGALAKLDYLADLGVGAILLSPVQMNGAEGYHGYHPVDLYQVEPRLGTLADLQALVGGAHARGIAVILDVVVNHMAPMIDWRRDGQGWRGVFRYDAADPAQVPLGPEGLRDPACFHDPSTDGDDVTGRLFGFLEDWRTEDAPVAAALVRALKYWVGATNVDGFRYDAARHVAPAFWRRATREVAEYAAAIGKRGFLQIGEHSSHEGAIVDAARAAGGFDAMIDYPLYYPVRDAGFGDAGAFARLAARLARRDSAGPSFAFLENHDSDRLFGLWQGRFGDADAARAAVAAWLALLLLGPDSPIIAQGQEQDFDGRLVTWTTPDGQTLVSDAHVREDMFRNPDCVWRFGPVNRPKHPPYDATNPTWRLIARLARLRRARPALWRGEIARLRDGDDGVFCWIADDGRERATVAVNLTGEDQALDAPNAAPVFRIGAATENRLGPYGAAMWASALP